MTRHVNLLPEYRRREKLTQKELAAKSGVSVDGISKLERGVSKPRPATAKKLAKALHGQVGKIFPYGVNDNVPSQAKKQAMAEGTRRAAAARGQLPEVSTKKCAGPCGLWKDRDEFSTTYKTTKSGERRAYVYSWCKKCTAERTARWRKENPEKAKESDRAAGRKHRRSSSYKDYQREWAAAKRRREGKPVRKDYELRRGKRIMLDSAPLLEWWDGGAAWPIEEVDPDAARSMRRSRPGSTEADATPGEISLANADRIFTVSGRPDLLPVLYPE